MDWLSPAPEFVLELYLPGCHLAGLPSTIATLTHLETLDLSTNNLSLVEEPSWSRLASLTALQQLDLSSNGLKSVPSFIIQLPSLRDLHLGHNELSELWLDAQCHSSLQSLVISDNQLRYLPTSFRTMNNLKSLSIERNSFDRSLVGDSFEDGHWFPLKQSQFRSHTPSELARLIMQLASNWFRGRAKMSRFKLALIGDGHVGKTTLRHQLLGLPIDDISRTKCIEQTCWTPDEADGKWQFDLWDFPGQAEHYVTHNLFWSDWQCIFLLLCDLSRSDWSSSLEEWMRFLNSKSSSIVDRYLSQDSSSSSNSAHSLRVMIVGTHIDRVADDSRARRLLKLHVENIQRRQTCTTIELVDALDMTNIKCVSTLREKLISVGRAMIAHPSCVAPLTFVQVIDWMVQQREKKREYCSLGDVAKAFSRDIERAELIWILKQLHGFGEALFMPDDPNGDHGDDEVVVFSFTWVLKRIGLLVDRDTKLEAREFFTTMELAELWGDECDLKSAEMTATILERLWFCCRSTESSDTRWIIPELLPPLPGSSALVRIQAKATTLFLPPKDEVLPSGAFGRLQSRWYSLVQQSTNLDLIVQVKLYRQLMVVFVNGNPEFVVEYLERVQFSDRNSSAICLHHVGNNQAAESCCTSIGKSIHEAFQSIGCKSQLEEVVPCKECVSRIGVGVTTNVRRVCRTFPVGSGNLAFVCELLIEDVVRGSGDHSNTTRSTGQSCSSTTTVSSAASESPPSASQLGTQVEFRAPRCHTGVRSRLGEDNTDAGLWQLASELRVGSSNQCNLRYIEVFLDSLKRNLMTELNTLKSNYQVEFAKFQPNVARIAPDAGQPLVNQALLLSLNNHHHVSWNSLTPREQPHWSGGKSIQKPIIKALGDAYHRAIEATITASQFSIEHTRTQRLWGHRVRLIHNSRMIEFNVNVGLESTGPFLHLCDDGTVVENFWRETEILIENARANNHGFDDVVTIGLLLIMNALPSNEVSIPPTVLISPLLDLVRDAPKSAFNWDETPLASLLAAWLSRLAKDVSTGASRLAAHPRKLDIQQRLAELSHLAPSDMLSRLESLAEPCPQCQVDAR